MRNGFALPVALLAMVVIGAIVTGGFYAASQESRISSSVDLGSQAFYVAEIGLDEAIGTWKNAKLEDVLGDTTFPTETVTSGGQTLGTYEINARRIGLQLFMITSTGSVTSGSGDRQAVRRIGTLVRTLTPAMPSQSALAIFGGLTVGGNSNINGNDSGGPGCEMGDTVAGVAAYDSSLVAEGNRERITGNPPLEQDTTLSAEVLSDYGTANLDDLRAAATKIYAPGDGENGMGPATYTDSLGNEVCDTSELDNWGDPDGATACEDEFPIIWAQGDFSVQTGKGQGILIVDGNLTATGNFDFYGVIIVLGELYTTGTGNHLEGGVIVQGHGSLDSESTTLGNSLVQYSECRVKNAFDASTRPRPLAKRAWIDFSASTRAATLFSG